MLLVHLVFRKAYCYLFLLSLALTVNDRNLTFKKHRLSSQESKVLNISTKDFPFEHTTYVITTKCDAKGRVIRIPRGSNLVFKGDGCIMNAKMEFNETWLENPCFKSTLSYHGAIKNTEINLKDFETRDDTDLFFFVFSQLRNSSIVKFETRKYEIDALKYQNGRIDDDCFVEFRNKKGITFEGNGAEIIDSASSRVLSGALFSLFRFNRCSRVSIKELSYTWTYEPMIHPDVRGMIFIRTLNQCNSFEIDVNVNSCGRGVYSGKWNNVAGHPGRGLCDSKIIVHAQKVGYPIAIDKGDNLTIKDYFDIAHRGLYLAGVTNAKVHVEGKDAYSTQVNLLLTDTMDADGWYYCDNIDATVIDKGTVLSDRVYMAFCQIYSMDYKQFRGRHPYSIRNLKFHLFTPGGTNTSYELLNIKDMAGIGDTIDVVVDGDFHHNGKDDRLYRIYLQPKGTVVFNNVRCHNNTIAYSGNLPDGCNLVFNNCPNVYFEWGSQKEPSTGKIEFHGCTFKTQLKKLPKINDGHYVKVIND